MKGFRTQAPTHPNPFSPHTWRLILSEAEKKGGLADIAAPEWSLPNPNTRGVEKGKERTRTNHPRPLLARVGFTTKQAGFAALQRRKDARSARPKIRGDALDVPCVARVKPSR